MGEKRNITITVDDETAQWVRVEAARRGTSMSQFVGELLAEERSERTGYDAAAQRFLSREPRILSEEGGSYPTREELHDL